MSGNNRYLSGKKYTTLAPVKGIVEIEAGDFVFLNNHAGALGTSSASSGFAADNYVYPFSMLSSTAPNAAECIIADGFLGVALESSPSGVTENITVAQGEVFRMYLNPVGNVTMGLIASACTQPSIGCSPHHVAVGNILAPGSTGYLGYVVKTESGATFVDVLIQGAFGPNGVVPQV